MKVIRHSCFETNSSSVHTLVITTAKEYEQFENGESVFDRDSKKLVSKAEMEKSKEIIARCNNPFCQRTTDDIEEMFCKKCGGMIIRKGVDDDRYTDFEDFNYINDISYARFKKDFTCSCGKVYVCFGYHGRDY